MVNKQNILTDKIYLVIYSNYFFTLIANSITSLVGSHGVSQPLPEASEKQNTCV